MMRKQQTRAALLTLYVVAMSLHSLFAQKIAPPVASLRVYLFDCGLIKGENPDRVRIE